MYSAIFSLLVTSQSDYDLSPGEIERNSLGPTTLPTSTCYY